MRCPNCGTILKPIKAPLYSICKNSNCPYDHWTELAINRFKEGYKKGLKDGKGKNE